MFQEERKCDAPDDMQDSPEALGHGRAFASKNLDCPPICAHRKGSMGFAPTGYDQSNSLTKALFQRSESAGSDSRPSCPHRQGSMDIGLLLESQNNSSSEEATVDNTTNTGEEGDPFFQRCLPVFTVSAVSTLSDNNSATVKKAHDDDDDDVAHRRDSAASRLESLIRRNNRSSFLLNRTNLLAKAVFGGKEAEEAELDLDTESVVQENDRPASIFCRVSSFMSSAASSVTGGSDLAAEQTSEPKTFSMHSKRSMDDSKPKFPLRRASVGMGYDAAQHSNNSPRPMDGSNMRNSIASAPAFFPNVWRRGSMASSVTFDDESFTDYGEETYEIYQPDKDENTGMRVNIERTYDSTPHVPSRRESMSTGGGSSFSSRRDSLSTKSNVPCIRRDNMTAGSNSCAPRMPGRRGSMTMGDLNSGRRPGRRASMTTSLQESFPELSAEEETLMEDESVDLAESFSSFGGTDMMEGRRFYASLDSMPEEHEGCWSSSEESIDFCVQESDGEEETSVSLFSETSPEELKTNGDMELDRIASGTEDPAVQMTSTTTLEQQEMHCDKSSATCTTAATSTTISQSQELYPPTRKSGLSRSSSESMKTRASKDRPWMITVKENMSTMFRSTSSLMDQPAGGRRIKAHNSLLAVFRSA